MPLKTSIILSQVQSESTEEVSNGMSGYRLDLEVVSATNIDTKIFILQREVLSLGVLAEDEDEDDPYEDTFYSVASVPQMESVPEAVTDDVQFYRVGSVSLVFASVEELQAGLDSILGLITLLQEANDRVINLLPARRIGFPAESIARFWGYTTETTITDEILLAGLSDVIYDAQVDVLISGIPGPRYLYLALPASLAAVVTIKVSGGSVSFVSVTRDVETVAECSVSYKIYRTASTVAAGSALLESLTA